MTSYSETVALEINGESISLSDALRFAKWIGNLQFIQAAVETTLIRQAATERGIEVSSDELQQAADDFRVSRDLHDAEATEAWLASKHFSYADWELLLETQVITHKLREALTAGRVEQHFAEQRLSFDAATLSRIVLKDEDVARELRAQIIEEGADFHVLARQYSIDDATKLAGGYSGLIRRTLMEAAVESAVFGAQAGKIVGPLKTDEGWQLIKIESLSPATLDDQMRETIKSLLFDEWLSERRRKARISIPLLEAAAE
ncbi:MAG: peptidylprolyl isomerase [Pyrinomonadaceae bacterium]|nr:peptidylprolyl isomerase [Pyrinomonadaceae bacterium]